jgi:hypothetical protein
MPLYSPELCKDCSNAVSKAVTAAEDTFVKSWFILMPTTCCICAHLVRGLVPDAYEAEALRSYQEVQCYYLHRVSKLYVRPSLKFLTPVIFELVSLDGTCNTHSGLKQLLNIPTDCQLRWTPDVPADTMSPDSISFLKYKLKECLNTHVSCHERRDARTIQYPTRLLNLTRHDSFNISLEETNSATRGHYFTLSHCWGGSKPLGLTKDTEKLLREGFPINTLPKTFQHAIDVCRKIGIPYLWIDSLCIFQDDLSDWETQAASMREVYVLSLCNIAAKSAANSSYGLRFHRDPIARSPFTMAVPKQYWLNGIPLVQYVAYPVMALDEDVRRGPLNQRAWVLQERLLSRRIMHFTKSGVYWECLTGMADETWREGLPQVLLDTSANFPVTELKRAMLRDPTFDGNETLESWTADLYDSWNQVCERYSLCQLTVASDKLVALDGIAREVSLKTEDALVWGLWRRHLFSQLLWVHSHQTKYPRINDEWRAPSWSWAQHDISITHITHVACEGSVERASVKDIDIDASLSEGLPMASLKLCGHLAHATMIRTTEGEFPTFSPTRFDFRRTTQVTIRKEFRTSLDYPCREHIFDTQVVCIAVYEDTCGSGFHVGSDLPKARLGVLVLRQVCSEPIRYKRLGILLVEEGDYEFYTLQESPEEHTITII